MDPARLASRGATARPAATPVTASRPRMSSYDNGRIHLAGEPPQRERARAVRPRRSAGAAPRRRSRSQHTCWFLAAAARGWCDTSRSSSAALEGRHRVRS